MVCMCIIGWIRKGALEKLMARDGAQLLGLVSRLSREDVCVSYPCLYQYLGNSKSRGNRIWFIS